MSKINISVKIFELPYRLNEQRLRNWKSNLFEIRSLEHYEISEDCDLPSWGYSDSAISRIMDAASDCDITLGIINETIEDDYYLRRLTANRAVLSLSNTAVYLENEHISLTDFVLRNLYEIALVFKAYKGTVPPVGEISMVHDATRGCLFDMSGNISNVVFSSKRPSLCNSCLASLRSHGLSREELQQVEKELSRIRQSGYYQLKSKIQEHPYIALSLSLSVAFILNLLASCVFAWLTK